MPEKAPVPTKIQLHQQSKVLELVYPDQTCELSCELLRVFSPSADVRGHRPEEATLQTGKINVGITDIKPVGHYAIQFTFSDGHETGIYSWNYLYDLCQKKEEYWEDYLRQLKEAGASRDPDIQVVTLGEWKPE